MKKALITVALLLSSQTAMSEWIEYHSSDGADAVKYYLDADSIRMKGYIVEVSGLMDFTNPRDAANGSQYMSAKSQQKFDCQNKKFTYTYIGFWSEKLAKGDEVFSADYPTGDYYPIQEDSIGEYIFKQVCPRSLR
jgi:hypothetical protein